MEPIEYQIKYDVFISYSSVDESIIKDICDYLEAKEVRCFVAYRDIKKGEDFAKVIPPALRNSRMMLAVFSDHFNKSDDTDNELHIASRRKKPILTFRITDDDFEGVKEYYLTKSNWIDAFPEPKSHFDELLSGISILADKRDLYKNFFGPLKTNSESLIVQSDVANARALLYNVPEKRNALKAFYLLNKIAKDGSAAAQYEMGMCCWYGWGTPQSWEQARYWLQLAADKGHNRAKHWLAKMWHYAIGGEQNIMQALELYTAAAEGGDGPAAKTLGKVYHTGELGVYDEARSQEWYARSADLLKDQSFETDDSEAMRTLGWSYQDAEGVRRDYFLGVEWLRYAAQMHDAYAVNGLARCYRNGEGVAKDMKMGVDLLKLASDMGCRAAQNSMASHFKEMGDTAKEKEYRLQAANGGNGTAQAMLAIDYYEGNAPFEKNSTESERWYGRAIESGSLKAIFSRAEFYENKKQATCDDFIRAANYYKQAAFLGYPFAWVSLGNCYYNNRGVDKSYANAELWYRRYLDQYYQTIEEGRDGIYVPTGQGGTNYISINDNSYRKKLLECCENLIVMYRNSQLSDDEDRIDMYRLKELVENLKQQKDQRNSF